MGASPTTTARPSGTSRCQLGFPSEANRTARNRPNSWACKESFSAGEQTAPHTAGFTHGENLIFIPFLQATHIVLIGLHNLIVDIVGHSSTSKLSNTFYSIPFQRQISLGSHIVEHIYIRHLDIPFRCVETFVLGGSLICYSSC